MRRCSNRQRAFTLIETMLAVLLLGLLASGAVLSFSKPVRASRAQQGIDEVCAADRAARLAATRTDRAVRLTFDPRGRSIRLYERDQIRSQVILNDAAGIDRILVGQRLVRGESATIDFSGSGYSASYAIHLPSAWIVFHGLTGQTTFTPNEQTARTILDPQAN